MHPTTALAAGALALLAAPSLSAQAPTATQDWPHFLGPQRDGTGVVSGVDFTTWNDTPPEVLWRIETGPGYGGAAIEGDDVVVLDRETDKDILRILDFNTGAERVRNEYASPGRLQFPGSRTVPIIDGESIYTLGGFGHVTAWERESGEILWQTDVREDYAGVLPMFGYSCTLLQVEDTVVVTALGEQLGLVALDAETGAEVWSTEPIRFSHVSPVRMTLFGQDTIVTIGAPAESGANAPTPATVWGFDAQSGDTLWSKEITFSAFPIPSVVQLDENHLFLTAGYTAGSVLFRLEPGTGDDGAPFELVEVFRNPRGSQVHQPMIYQDHIYFMANENLNERGSRRKQGGLMCMDMEGNELWRTGDDPYLGLGNMIRIGEFLLIQDGDDGTLRVVRANPEKYDLVYEGEPLTSRGRNQLWGPMALARNRLVRRGKNELLCLQM